MLESLSGLNFFLAVEKVMGGSLALGRFLRLFTQLGMDLHAHPCSASKFHSRQVKKTHIFRVLFFLRGHCLTGYVFLLGLSH